MADPNQTTQTSGGGCPPCDLGAIDDLQCEGEALQKQAELTAEYQTALEERRAKLATARAAYTEARAAAKDDVETIDRQLKNAKEQLDCLMKDVDLDCLKSAYYEVKQELDECGGAATGCCAEEECEFDDNVEDVEDKDLIARIAEIEKRVAEAEACFDLLITEPDDLAARVSTLGEKVAQLVTDICAEDPEDRARLYIRLLVLTQWRKDLWKGFDDANDFYNCLCQALTCAVAGRKVLVKLQGERVMRECKARKKQERCDALRENLVDEVWAVYVKKCKSKPYPDYEGEKPGEGEPYAEQPEKVEPRSAEGEQVPAT